MYHCLHFNSGYWLSIATNFYAIISQIVVDFLIFCGLSAMLPCWHACQQGSNWQKHQILFKTTTFLGCSWMWRYIQHMNKSEGAIWSHPLSFCTPYLISPSVVCTTTCLKFTRFQSRQWEGPMIDLQVILEFLLASSMTAKDLRFAWLCSIWNICLAADVACTVWSWCSAFLNHQTTPPINLKINLWQLLGDSLFQTIDRFQIKGSCPEWIRSFKLQEHMISGLTLIPSATRLLL
jgi:hypothetical protein